MNADERRLNQITEAIIGCAYSVSNELGVGFLEKIYENSMKIELVHQKFKVITQQPIEVFYRGSLVGEYYCDLLVEDLVIVEIKHTKAIDVVHEAQLLNYLKATGLKVGLIINFGKAKIEIKRMANQL